MEDDAMVHDLNAKVDMVSKKINRMTISLRKRTISERRLLKSSYD
jgi:hypothetical protein